MYCTSEVEGEGGDGRKGYRRSNKKITLDEFIQVLRENKKKEDSPHDKYNTAPVDHDDKMRRTPSAVY